MWCVTLPDASIQSFDQLIRELTHDFYRYDRKALNKKIIKLKKTLDESIKQFHKRFRNIAYQIIEDGINWKFLDEIF